ncbi:AbiV family abortive infection protein [Nocardioides sp. IC4_145]|nr:AbiV family abortive infection protein [Nocardioides sp. IC4_145]
MAILGLEESGKAIAVHEGRVQMTSTPEGEPFRCSWLDELWASHQQKLEKVHGFLLMEPYWFGQPPDYDENATFLGTIRAWARGHDRSKQRGFYVDLGKTGAIMAPPDVADEGALRDVIGHVHQIGWQLRLGEHIEGKRQDEQEQGHPPMDPKTLDWLEGSDGRDSSPYLRRIAKRMRESLSEGVPR